MNLKDRPRQPVQRRGDDLITLNAEQAMQGAADILRQSKKVIGIGSPRASVESNFALRELVGAATSTPVSPKVNRNVCSWR
ncbi:hypothetical protein ACNKHO_14525 [Shigella flexneri]